LSLVSLEFAFKHMLMLVTVLDKMSRKYCQIPGIQ